MIKRRWMRRILEALITGQAIAGLIEMVMLVGSILCLEDNWPLTSSMGLQA
jgi:hypothetical protein